MNNSDIKVSLISLGCSKNLVDAECMTKLIKDSKMTMVDDVAISNVAIINTCGFIESAKTEAISTILDVAELKAPKGNVELIIVTGCLSQRYSEEIKESLPEVDAILGTSHYQDIVEVILALLSKKESLPITHVSKAGGIKHLLPSREISTTGYAWLKIGEGCRNCCTFCAIPLIRGKFISRPLEDVLEEARDLASRGYKELILAAQDTTNYGIDIYGKRSLPKLLHSLAQIDGIDTIRVMYGYMDGLDDELIEEMRTNSKVAHYMDIPIQHADDMVLKAMNRRDTSSLITERLSKLRQAIPDLVVRTTVMVGFPGETEEAFENLKEKLKLWRFDRLGCFIFSAEEGTKAFDMPNQIDDETKQRRYDEIYALQQSISKECNSRRMNQEIMVTIDSVSDDGIFYKGRSYGEAPDVDPTIFVVSTNDELTIGDRYKVKIVDYSEYELTGVTI